MRNQIMERGILAEKDLHVPKPALDEEILFAHQAAYFKRVMEGSLSDREIHRIGLPWSPEFVERTRRSIGGSISACRAALQEGTAINLGGGIHHAHYDFGSGYCIFNDCAIAARTMQAEGLAGKVLILDCDVHQGDGTAAIFTNDPSVFTFFIHGERNFPNHKRLSDLDIALEDSTTDEAYLRALQFGIMRVFDVFQADLGIYLAGADPYFDDRLGRLALTKDGLENRDLIVIQSCQQACIPLVIVMAGGYSRSIEDSIDIHSNTIRLLTQIADGFST